MENIDNSTVSFTCPSGAIQQFKNDINYALMDNRISEYRSEDNGNVFVIVCNPRVKWFSEEADSIELILSQAIERVGIIW